MDCSPDPGTTTAFDHPPYDVAVYCPDPFLTFLPLSIEFVSLPDNLRHAGFRVEDNLSNLPPFSGDPTPARVNVVIVSSSRWIMPEGQGLSPRNVPRFCLPSTLLASHQGIPEITPSHQGIPEITSPQFTLSDKSGGRYVSQRHFPYFERPSIATVIRSGEPVIPVYLDGGPDEVQDELERFCCLERGDGSPMLPKWKVDAFRRLLTISGHDLARYDGDEDKLKMDVFIEVSKVVNTHRIAEANELRSQNHIYKKRVSVSEEKARRAAELAVSYLKLLAGELLKHAMDNVCPPSSHTAAHSGPSSKFWNRAHFSEVRKVAMRLSMKPRHFAKKADRCIDDRNEVAHFLADKNWRKHCADAVQFINRYPDVKTVIPVQCDIILAHELICDEFGL